MVTNNSLSSDDDDFAQKVDELLSEVGELKKVAARNVLRAADIANSHPHELDVSRLLLGEAAVMMSVASRIEDLLDPPPNRPPYHESF